MIENISGINIWDMSEHKYSFMENELVGNF